MMPLADAPGQSDDKNQGNAGGKDKNKKSEGEADEA